MRPRTCDEPVTPKADFRAHGLDISRLLCRLVDDFPSGFQGVFQEGVTRGGLLPLFVGGEMFSAGTNDWEANHVNILWIILIVILVLALLGFFSRGRW